MTNVKNILILPVFILSLLFLQSCRESSVGPVDQSPGNTVGKRTLLTQHAWKLVDGGDLIGGISVFYNDGTFWVQDDNVEGNWTFLSDSNAIAMGTGGSWTDTVYIGELTGTRLILTDNEGKSITKFEADRDFNRRGQILMSQTWKLSDGDMAGRHVIFHSDSSCFAEDDLPDGVWRLGRHNTELEIYGTSLAGNYTVAEMSGNRIVLKTIRGGSEITLSFVTDAGFSKRRYLLTRTPWLLVPQTSEDTPIWIRYGDDGYAEQRDIPYTGQSMTAPWELRENETVLRISIVFIGVFDATILELTKTEMRVRVTDGTDTYEEYYIATGE